MRHAYPEKTTVGRLASVRPRVRSVESATAEPNAGPAGRGRSWVSVVTADEWAGFGHTAALAEIAPRLPELRHRVVFGEPADGEIDFRSFFEETPWERHHPVARDDAREDPDRVAMVFEELHQTGKKPQAPGRNGAVEDSAAATN